MSEDRLETEESIIEPFLAPLAAGYAGAWGLKDDCAVIAPPTGCDLVLKTDPVIAGVHFLPTDPPGDIAWKALAVNVSDLAAKGAEPLAYLMALALPEAPERAWMAAFAAGLAEAQAAFGCTLIGGDTDRTPGPLTVSITAIGTIPAGRTVRRGTARAGDDLWVTGTLGDAALGLALTKEPELAKALGLNALAVERLTRRFRRPQPRIAAAHLVREHAQAAMDLSDGLLKDCARLCRASGLGARIDAATLPLSAQMRSAHRQRPRWADIAAHGDDYEILLTAAPERAADLRAMASAAGVALTRIGRLHAGSGVSLIGPDGAALELGRSGWDHFQPRAR